MFQEFQFSIFLENSPQFVTGITNRIRKMASQSIITQKGASKKHTYYVPSEAFTDTLPQHLQTLSPDLGALSPDLEPLSPDLGVLSPELQKRIKSLGLRIKPETMEQIILDICAETPMNLDSLSKILKKSPDHIRKTFINKLMKEKKLTYTIPEVVTHPKQAYRTTKNDVL